LIANSLQFNPSKLNTIPEISFDTPMLASTDQRFKLQVSPVYFAKNLISVDILSGTLSSEDITIYQPKEKYGIPWLYKVITFFREGSITNDMTTWHLFPQD
jgi:hypothetical protein